MENLQKAGMFTISDDWQEEQTFQP